MVFTLIHHKMPPLGVQNLAVKPLAYGSWFQLSFELAPRGFKPDKTRHFMIYKAAVHDLLILYLT